MYVFYTHIQCPFRCIPWTRIVWSQRNLCSALIDTANQLSKMVVRIYIQINRVQKTQWFHIFFSFWYFSLLKQLFQEQYTISYCGINLYFLMSICLITTSLSPYSLLLHLFPSPPPMIMCMLKLSIMSNSFVIHGLQPASLLCQWNSPGKNTGVGSHSLLQGIFPTKGLNPCLLH